MPEDSNKKSEKRKNDPKEQRKPRQRHQQLAADKKSEKKFEEHKNVPKAPQKDPEAFQRNPPPEFYSNLKRETDEILKITEEENSKYKKKEIQSNWSKYEMPIDSYEEIEEQEKLGADYEKLIQAPSSVGGHFQFKHEKSWDLNTGPSLYDKYFEINMDDLNTALNTIPFHERNSIEKSLFNEADLLTMNNRSNRFKQKYYNDKSYSTPETEILERIVSKLKDDDIEKENKISQDTVNKPIPMDMSFEIKPETKSTSVDLPKEAGTNNIDGLESNVDMIDNNKNSISKLDVIQLDPKVIETEISNIQPVSHVKPGKKELPVVDVKDSNISVKKEHAIHEVAEVTVELSKNPVIESPEDLEKWLDDFLEG